MQFDHDRRKNGKALRSKVKISARNAYRGKLIDGHQAYFVNMHSVGKILSKCGYSLDCNELEDYEVEALCVIESTYNELEAMDLKRSKK